MKASKRELQLAKMIVARYGPVQLLAKKARKILIKDAVKRIRRKGILYGNY